MLEKREVRGAAGRKRAILAGMKGGDVEAKVAGKGGEIGDKVKGDVKDGEVGVTAAAIDRKEVEIAMKKEEVEVVVGQCYWSVGEEG